ncbi:MAG: nitrilase, partial [Deltaproteobacteria bacterium]
AIGPSGKVIDRYLDGREGIMVVDLAAADLSAVREHRMRYFLPNRRPEIYQAGAS